MGVSGKFRKILVNNETFYWYVREGIDDNNYNNKLDILITTQNKQIRIVERVTKKYNDEPITPAIIKEIIKKHLEI